MPAFIGLSNWVEEKKSYFLYDMIALYECDILYIHTTGMQAKDA